VCVRGAEIPALLFLLRVTLKGFFDGNTSMWKGVTAWASLMSILGLLEGMQIALFPVFFQGHQGRACKCQVCSDDMRPFVQGKGMQSLRVHDWKSAFVVFYMFVVAHVNYLIVVPCEVKHIYGVSDGFQAFFNLGFKGALVATILGTISRQLVA
jgi:hypothetical protein